MTSQRNHAGRTAALLQDWNRHMLKFVTAIAVSALLMFVAASGVKAEELSKRFGPHDPASKVTIDHSLWDTLLNKHLHVGEDGLNRFDYAGLKKDGIKDLKKYLDQLQAVKPKTLNRDEQFAFWTNLYNAATVDVVAEHYPVDSIRDIRLTSFILPGPWREDAVKVDGVDLSLDDIEHKILRPIWRDPRIHYVVNCAAVGCPNLQNEAYTSAKLETMLERAARQYINSPRGVRFDGKDIIVSSLFDWYGDDWGGTTERILTHIRKYAEPVLADRLAGATSISDYEYDWALNDKK